MQIDEGKLKSILLNAGILDEAQWEDVIKNAHRLDVLPEDILRQKDIISGHLYYEILAKGLGVNYVNLKRLETDEGVLDIFSGDTVNKYGAIPFEISKNKTLGRVALKVAFTKQWDKNSLRILQTKARRKIDPYLTDEASFRTVFVYYKKSVAEQIKKLVDKKSHDHSDAEDVFDLVMEYIYYTRPSDVHIEQFAESGMIKLRIDGFLKDEFEMDPKLTQALINIIKKSSETTTDEDNQTDDGRFSVEVFDEELAFRVSIMPTFYGEKICLRVLDDTKQKLSLHDLGFSDSDVAMLKKEFEKPYGLILINGPTGSGKSTTLYSILKFLNVEGTSIATIEDPVEYPIKHINQSQVDEDNGFTFSRGLKELLRQDPDIVVIGEIRDGETASIAVNAALTGHIVLSTIHSNTAVGTITRLENMGVPNYLLAPTLNLAISQRLIKKMCPYCRESFTPEKKYLDKLDKDFGLYASLAKLKKLKLISFKTHKDILLFKSHGCARCSGKGFTGRIGAFEILNTNSDIQEMILENKSEQQIHRYIGSRGALTMFEDGLLKALNGETTIEAMIDVVR